MARESGVLIACLFHQSLDLQNGWEHFLLLLTLVLICKWALIFFFCHGENLDLQKRKKKCFPTFYRVTRTWESCRIYLLKHWWRIINRVAQWFRGRLWSLMDPSLNIWHLLIVCPWTITHLTVPQFTAQYVCDNNTNLICIRWELSYTRSQNSHNKHLSPYKLFLLNKGWELGN